MSDPERFEYAISEKIRAHAMTFPDTEEGSSCVNRAFKAGGKNFAFLGEKPDLCNLRLKLDASLPEVRRLAEDDPERWEVGTAGWTMIRFSPKKPPPVADLRRWITESFHLLAPKKVIAKLDA